MSTDEIDEATQYMIKVAEGARIVREYIAEGDLIAAQALLAEMKDHICGTISCLAAEGFKSL